MLKLACPSCGANLELPETLNVAHCMYCGGKVILRSESALDEIVNVKRFSDLAQVAIQAKNYQDAIKYSDSVLEIDTQNIEAWLIKAEAVFWLSTPHDDKFDTAMKYLDAASRISPGDARIAEARTRISQAYALWLNSRGVSALELGRRFGSIAKAQSRSEYLEAMQLFLTAFNYDVDNVTTLRNIRICAQEASWIAWNSTVREKLDILQRLEARETAKQYVAGIANQLAKKKAKLKSLEGKNGFWDKLTRDDICDEINALEKQLKEYQAKASYEVPRGNVIPQA